MDHVAAEQSLLLLPVDLYALIGIVSANVPATHPLLCGREDTHCHGRLFR